MWTARELKFVAGEVRVFAADEGRELWRLAPGHEKQAALLVELGGLGVGGFVASGRDAEGLWLGRKLGSRSLNESWQRAETSWRAALKLGVSIARALGVCERRGLWPGALHPKHITLDSDTESPTLRAEALVRAQLAMEPDEGLSTSTATRWTAPEQADGAAWDAAANRYVCGLILYRMLAGEHPVQGQGLRLGLERLATRGPAPFTEARARDLPPGLQAFCLALLSPERNERPQDAADIVQTLEAFMGGTNRAPKARAVEPETSPRPALGARSRPSRSTAERGPAKSRETASAPKSRGVPSRANRWGTSLSLAVPLVGLLAIAWVLSGASAPTSKKPQVLSRAPLGGGALGSGACESCHPRQTAEWRRSVMAHSVKSPMFLALEALIQEQAGKSDTCRHGAGIMRRVLPGRECRDPESGVVLTGSAGEHWCVNCHSPATNLGANVPAWDALSVRSTTRRPLDSLLEPNELEGISCAFCHQVHGPVGGFRAGSTEYFGNASWTSPVTGAVFLSRPEDQVGRFGIANSGYQLDEALLGVSEGDAAVVKGGVHRRIPESTRAYLGTSEFCGACHDVRLFGTDVLGRQRGEHFKRLRNAYSEWRDWAEQRKRQGRQAYSCQDCHMSRFPGVCVPGPGDQGGCPAGSHFVAVEPGSYGQGPRAVGSEPTGRVSPHYFSGVDVPLAPEFPEDLIDEASVDTMGIPLGARQRRDLLLARSIRMTLSRPVVRAGLLEVPVSFENVGAGHRIPAGFSQERELWLHLRITDDRGRLVYEVGRVERGDEDLHDKRFLRVTTDPRLSDPQGRPLGLFGADVVDGHDVPRWSPDPGLGGTEFRGSGLVNFQNGFLRCVVCLGTIDREGRCQALPGQEGARADRYADGDYDIDTGRCNSNLSGTHALFETYFPVGSLDAQRGVLKAPDAIIDTRSLPPEVPVRYVYALPLRGTAASYRVEARLLFRAFPPFLLRAFSEYEQRQSLAGLRPKGPLIDARALERLEVVEVARAESQLRP